MLRTLRTTRLPLTLRPYALRHFGTSVWVCGIHPADRLRLYVSQTLLRIRTGCLVLRNAVIRHRHFGDDCDSTFPL